MGDPRWSYDDMCVELCRLRGQKIEDPALAEQYIKECKRDNRFYFDAGVAMGNVIADISFNCGCDELNAACGGVYMFENMIGVRENDS